MKRATLQDWPQRHEGTERERSNASFVFSESLWLSGVAMLGGCLSLHFVHLEQRVGEVLCVEGLQVVGLFA
jgi:hypothetical protein